MRYNCFSALTGICPYGKKHLLFKNVPRTCMRQACPRDYQCTFSKKLRNYFCCSGGTKLSSRVFHIFSTLIIIQLPRFGWKFQM